MYEEQLITEMIVEIPKGSTNKYEYNAKKQAFVLDRPLYGANFYPGEYGYIDKTLDFDGDPLDIIALINNKTFPGCLISVRVLGAIEMIDNGEIDTKIFGVVASDPRFEEYKTLNNVPKHLLDEITNFFLQYKKLQNKEVVIKGWLNKEAALKEIKLCKELYNKYSNEILNIPKSDLIKLLAQEHNKQL